jgi:CTP synthase
VVPHITNEIKERIRKAAEQRKVDIVIIEIGGTIGDIESLPFLEAIRQFRLECGRGNAINIHLTLVPYLRAAGELKTKPTQHSVSQLLSIGIQPDIIVCRTEQPLGMELKNKISLFCNVEPQAVIQAIDVRSIYEVPLMFQSEGLDAIVLKYLGIHAGPAGMEDWKKIVHLAAHPPRRVAVGVVGKYTEVQDAYKSIKEALTHGGFANRAAVDITWINSDQLECNRTASWEQLRQVQGILVPGGFGSRGVEGKIAAIQYARENRVPYLGICIGMQCAVIEFARHVAHLKGANSTELDEQTPYPVISLLAEQRGIKDMGGTMRLGAYPCTIQPKTLAAKAYSEKVIFERHRHRYEFNSALFQEAFAKLGMVFSGLSPDASLVEMIELKDHPWFVATQFHPEFKSKPTEPHPLFQHFIRAALDQAHPVVRPKPKKKQARSPIAGRRK